MKRTEPRPPVTLLTDFGHRDAYAGVLHAVIAGIAPHVAVVDLCHEVPPQDVSAGAFLLMTAYQYFPAGTIHLAVVDPGVGTTRWIIAVRTGTYTFVGPDNGVLRWAVDAAGGPQAIVSVEAPAYRLPEVSHTFHGRDVMAPAAAHLANGVPLDALGPRVSGMEGRPFPQPVRERQTLAGEVVYVDRFGNCVTNLPPVEGLVEVAGHTIARRRAYGESPRGDLLALTGSAGFLEIAQANGNAAHVLGIGPGAPVTLRGGTAEPSPDWPR